MEEGEEGEVGQGSLALLALQGMTVMPAPGPIRRPRWCGEYEFVVGSKPHPCLITS
jgi:hypothetical protein